MKIGFHGLDLPEGKVKYHDPKLVCLERKIQPKKVVPFFVEFLRDEYVQCDGILVTRATLLDVLIVDMEKMETRRDRSTDTQEQQLVQACLAHLERGEPVCTRSWAPEELVLLRGLAPVTLKPTVVVDEVRDTQAAIELMLCATNTVFFYTVGKTEVRAWPVASGTNIVTCAGKIHSDMARGFIRADVVGYEEFMKVHGMQEAREKGLVKVVDRDYLIQPGDIIEVRFSV
ncbi:MAG: DUF933 domain-containing protein [bacterium]|nr:DUF933 domain-containing protein [bacterium]